MHAQLSRVDQMNGLGRSVGRISNAITLWHIYTFVRTGSQQPAGAHDGMVLTLALVTKFMLMAVMFTTDGARSSRRSRITNVQSTMTIGEFETAAFATTFIVRWCGGGC